LAVLSRVAAALRVSIEELLTAPRLMGRLIRSHQLEHHRRGGVVVRKLLPDPLPGLDLERMELPPGARMKGVPHTPGCREYLTCESGVVEIAIEGSVWRLEAGDVFVFRGDQRHSYHNPGDVVAVAYSALRI
jgi:quercetin dioxygenase-like cupin family protein